jgi:hypothetical protein
MLSLVIAAMLRRGLHRDFPWFFVYCIFAATTSLAGVSLFLTHRLDGRFVYCMLINEAGCLILRFAVIYELFVTLMRPYPALKNTAHRVFRVAMAVLILGGVVLAASYRWSPDDYHYLIPSFINVADRTVDVIQCGILLLLVLLSKYLSLSWRDYAFGVAIGLGIYAAVDLAIASLLVVANNLTSEQQDAIDLGSSILSMSTYLFSILIWFVYALLPERAPKLVTTIPDHDLNAWDHELQRLLER